MIEVSKNLIGFNNLLIELTNNLFNKSLPNSLIFYGNKGIGKTTFCYSFIDQIYKKLYSSKHSSNLIYNNSHPKFRILNRLFDEKTKKLKNYITIDQIRGLESFIFQSSFDNHPKFVIFDSADDLNIHSSNALLKRDIIRYCKDQNYRYYLLGGGINGIYRYKMGFAPLGSCTSYVGGMIYNEDVYRDLKVELVNKGVEINKNKFQFYDI